MEFKSWYLAMAGAVVPLTTVPLLVVLEIGGSGGAVPVLPKMFFLSGMALVPALLLYFGDTRDFGAAVSLLFGIGFLLSGVLGFSGDALGGILALMGLLDILACAWHLRKKVIG